MKVIATQTFFHDEHRARRGDEIEVSDSVAAELEKRGLVKISKAKPEPEDKMAADPANKVKAKK